MNQTNPTDWPGNTHQVYPVSCFLLRLHQWRAWHTLSLWTHFKHLWMQDAGWDKKCVSQSVHALNKFICAKYSPAEGSRQHANMFLSCCAEGGTRAVVHTLTVHTLRQPESHSVVLSYSCELWQKERNSSLNDFLTCAHVTSHSFSDGLFQRWLKNEGVRSSSDLCLNQSPPAGSCQALEPWLVVMRQVVWCSTHPNHSRTLVRCDWSITHGDRFKDQFWGAWCQLRCTCMIKKKWDECRLEINIIQLSWL